MKKKTTVTNTYEKLMSQRYGNFHKQHDKNGHARRYGSEHGHKSGYGHGASPLALSKSFDDGEVLPQKDSLFAEYVVQSSITGTGNDNPEQYIIDNTDALPGQPGNGWLNTVAGNDPASASLSWSATSDMNWPPTLANQGPGHGAEDIQYEMIPPGSGNLQQEWQVDLMHPLQGPGQTAEPGGTASNFFGGPQERTPMATSDPFFASSSSADPYPEMPAEDPQKGRASDEDFMADMQSILLGEKVFDPVTKKTVDKAQLNRQATSRSSSNNNNNNGGSNAGNPQETEGPGEHAIFDKIAKSMQYANAYDLGTVELENRFADFDQLTDRKDNPPPVATRPAPASKTANPSAGPASLSFDELKVGNEDFLKDLDAIRDLEELRQAAAARQQPEGAQQSAGRQQPEARQTDEPATVDIGMQPA